MLSPANTHQGERRLGDFELGAELGKGGMGVVYAARQVSLNRKVALKVLSGHLGLSPLAVDRFRREAEAAARLHHTNIVPVYATGEQDGAHFYAMELIDGPSLDRVLERRRPTAAAYFDAVARLIADVADALDHAHKQWSSVSRRLRCSPLPARQCSGFSVTAPVLAKFL